MRILVAVARIPPGHVSTYGAIARLAGLEGRARLVGKVLRDLPDNIDVPWHRVINAAGCISERGDDSSVRDQRERLSEEGVEIDETGRIDLRRFGWPNERSIEPPPSAK